MSALTFTIQIASVTYDIKEGSIKFGPQVEQRDKLSFTVLDPTNAFNFTKGQQITLTDSISSIQFTGTIHTSVKYRIGTGNMRHHDIDCNDMHQVADERTSNRIYNGQYSGVIVASMTGENLAGDGISANYAIREDNTQVEFAQGTLSGTVATANNGGDLELSLAGSQVSIIENTTLEFSLGTLNNVTASNNTLSPTSTPAIRMTCTQSVPGNGNSYTYFEIWNTGSPITIPSPGTFLVYDLWIDSSSPQAQFGVDIVFTDGTKLRDNFVYTDVQGFSPHPNTDLTGIATDQWYHREFFLDNFSGKVIAYVSIACEGDNSGNYTAYFKNIFYLNNNRSLNTAFFGSSLVVSPAWQLQTTGYSNSQIVVVNTCDTYLNPSNRVSSSYNINNVGVVKDSFISYNVFIPVNYDFQLSYSIDGGSSYSPVNTNNAALTNLPSGMTVTGKSIQFLAEFFQLAKANPEQFPVLSFMELVLNPSYTTSKTDVLYSTATSWTGAGTTLTKTTGNGGILNLTGAFKDFDDGDTSNITLYGTSSPSDGCANRGFAIETGTANTDAKASMDFAGSFTDQVIDVDMPVESTFSVGVFYRTSNFGNNNDTYAYSATVSTTQVLLAKGSNSTGAGSFTSLGAATIAITSNNYHHLQVVNVGTNHKVYLDNILMLNITDATYAGPGKCGVRMYNPSGVAQQGRWDNFGVVAALQGTWTSPNTSIASATTYGTSVVWWSDASSANSTVNILVEASLNNGSTYATCTNGQPIPGLTPGQSLSGISVKFRVTLTTFNAGSFPGIDDFNVYVIGQFSSTGTRISPVLSLASALIAGSTVTNWTPITPPGTAITVETSPTGVGSWTAVNNGNPIAGIVGQPLPTLDTFDVNDSSQYLHIIRTGGSSGTYVWDTANSRVTVSGGTNDMLLYSPTWFNAGYLNKKQIIIDHTKVIGGSDLSNFPVPIVLFDQNLALPLYGGLVQNASGFDIIFVDSTETTKLDHEIERYNPATGEIEMWVRIPTLSHTVDTVIYIYFDNASITTTQENPTGVWDTNFKAVWHMDVATGSNQNDSTSTALTATPVNNPVQSSGEVDGDFSFDGLTQYFNVAGSGANITGDKMVELWINAGSFAADATATDPRIIINNIDGTNAYQFALDPNSSGNISFATNDSTGQHIITNSNHSINTWYYLVGTYTAATHVVTLDINGAAITDTGGVALGLGNIGFNIGRRTDVKGYYFGLLDEVRISNSVRTAGWRTTSYNSMIGSFFSIGSLVSQSAISIKDVDMIVDTDQMDRCGLVWRMTDASNFYELDIYDASSNAGNTNIVQLFKVVANVKTQIGSNVVINFIRATYHRFHMLMVGTAIKVWMDDAINTLINTTDASLAGPGKSGLIESSGTGHFYNLRIQPQGQSLSGVNAYTRVTLSSTNSAFTPQLTSLVLAALHPNIALGSYIPTVNYKRTYISANCDDLCKKSNTTWQIDANKNMMFGPRIALPAPWILTSNDILFPDDGSPDSLSIENGADLYRNRMILIGVLDVKPITETHPGDGQSTSWAMQYEIVGTNPTISVNGQVKTIGQKGIDTGKDFYYALGSNSLAQDPSGAILQPNIDSFTITYTGQFETEVVRNNTGGFTGTTTQSQYAALTGGSGIVEVVEDVTDRELSIAAASAYGDSLLQRFGVIGRTLTCMTNRTGLSVGQYIPVFIPELGLSDNSMLITAMDLTIEQTLVGSQVSMLYYWKLTLSEGPNLGSWQKTLLQAFV